MYMAAEARQDLRNLTVVYLQMSKIILRQQIELAGFAAIDREVRIRNKYDSGNAEIEVPAVQQLIVIGCEPVQQRQRGTELQHRLAKILLAVPRPVPGHDKHVSDAVDRGWLTGLPDTSLSAIRSGIERRDEIGRASCRETVW